MPEIFEYLERADRGGMEHDPDGELYYRILRKVDALPSGLATRPLLFSAMLYPLAMEEGLISADSPDRAVRHVLKVLAPRLGISRRDQERTQQILLAQRRMLPRKRKRTFPRTLVDRSYFPESFALFELIVQTTGQGQAELDWWNERLAELRGTGHVSPSPSPGLAQEPDEPEDKTKRRRKRRRRGRGRHGDAVAD